MKLFLASLAISKSQAPTLIELVGQPAQEIKLALIENAAEPEPGEKPWVAENRRAIMSHGWPVTIVDLNHYRDDSQGLSDVLARHDVIWLGGGNTYYLRWLLRQTKADAIITELIRQGKVYGGGSAGAVVAGPIIKGFESADNPKWAPEKIDEGLKLTDQVVVPHWANAEYGHVMTAIRDGLVKRGYKTTTLTDAQALLINGEQSRVVTDSI